MGFVADASLFKSRAQCLHLFVALSLALISQHENVELIPPNILKFDFLGKDSIRYENSHEVRPRQMN
jgi:hypothetical protein